MDLPVVCTICLDLPAGVVTTPCGHNFCQRCISQWCARSAKCPDCNGSLPSQALKVNIGLRDMLSAWAAANRYTAAVPVEGGKSEAAPERPRDLPSVHITRITDIANPAAWCCDAGHPLIVSEFRGGTYRNGWVCNNCRSKERAISTPLSLRHVCTGPGVGPRWFCLCCDVNVCFSCHERNGRPGSPHEQSAPLCASSSHVMALTDYAEGDYGTEIIFTFILFPH